MTAPTYRDEHDDDLSDETVPVSELLARHGSNPFRDVPVQQNDAPLRMDVSIAVFAALVLGETVQACADQWPGSSGIAFAGGLAGALLIVRWTRKR